VNGRVGGEWEARKMNGKGKEVKFKQNLEFNIHGSDNDQSRKEKSVASGNVSFLLSNSSTSLEPRDMRPRFESKQKEMVVL
jgi:hypothetical protein